MNNYKKYKHLYNSNKWKLYSKQFRLIHKKCAICGEPSKVVDHIVPHKGNKKLFWDTKLHQALCYQCHNSTKYRIEMGQVPGKDFVPNNKSNSNGLPESKFHPWNK